MLDIRQGPLPLSDDPFSLVADRCVAGILPYRATPGPDWSSDPRPPLIAERGYVPPPGWAPFHYWDAAAQMWRDTLTLAAWVPSP